MKKIAAGILGLMMLFSLAACSNGTDDPATTPTPDSVTLQPEREEGSNIITGYKKGDVSLPTYIGVKYYQRSTEVTDEEIQDRLDDFASIYKKKVEITDRDTVQAGDVVDIDYEGFKDGTAFENGSGSASELIIGSGQYLKEFEDGIIGQKKGSFSINVTFPEDHKKKELAGATVVFNITLKGIYYYDIPEFTDEFISERSSEKYKTVAEYKDYIRNLIKKEKEESAQLSKEEEIAHTLVDTAVYNKDLTSEIEYMVQSLKNNYNSLGIEKYGVDGAGYLYYEINLSSSSYEQYVRDEAEYSVKFSYVMSAIADDQNFQATDAEVEELTSNIMSKYHYGSKDVLYNEIKKNFGVEGVEYMKEQVRLNKASELVLTSAVPVEADEETETGSGSGAEAK